MTEKCYGCKKKKLRTAQAKLSSLKGKIIYQKSDNIVPDYLIIVFDLT